MGETGKAHARRKREGWYERYIFAPGVDIGSGRDPLPAKGFKEWDIFWTKDGDATTMPGVEPETFQTVYASHVLEHIKDPITALQSWYRVLKPGGYMIICVPHRDLYEKKKTKPSRWNPHMRPDGDGHVTFWLPFSCEPPDTLSMRETIYEAIPGAELVELRVLDNEYDFSLPDDVHPVGEYAIEAIVMKPVPIP